MITPAGNKLGWWQVDAGGVAGLAVLTLVAFLAVGFLGSYTTFSTYALESLLLIREGSMWLGMLDIASNLLIGLTCALAGIYLARWIAA